MNHLKWLDSLFKEYGNPTFLLNGLISSKQFSNWIDEHERNDVESTLWEMYLHKLGAYDDRSFDDFKNDMLKGHSLDVQERPSEEQLVATVNKSFELLQDFDLEERK